MRLGSQKSSMSVFAFSRRDFLRGTAAAAASMVGGLIVKGQSGLRRSIAGEFFSVAERKGRW